MRSTLHPFKSNRACIVLAAVLAISAGALISGCAGTTPQETPSAEERFRQGLLLYQDESYLDAIQEFEVIRLQYPASAVADSARYFSGMCRFNREEYLLASYEFNLLIQNHPSSPLLPDAQFRYAECYYELSPKMPLDQQYTQRAIDALQTFIELYPKNPNVEQAERQIFELYNKLAEKEYSTGVLYERLDNLASALIYFSTVIDRYYNTDYADDAMAAKIRILIRRKKTDEALQLIETFLKKFPDSDYRSEVEAGGNRLRADGNPSRSVR